MHIAILGNGISGITAARTLRKKSDHKITVISEEGPYFFSRTALMYVYMGHMKFDHLKPYEDHFWKKNKIDLLQERVENIDFKNRTLQFNSGGLLAFDKLILATGSKSNKFGWKGQDLAGVQGLYSKQDLDLLEKNTHPAKTPESQMKVKHAVIVGGGLIGIELAEMLKTRGIEVSLLIREDRFWGNVLPEEEAGFISKHIKKHGVQLLLNDELEEILGDAEGRVQSIRTKSGKEIACQLVGLTAGVSPNVSFLKDTELEVNRGVLVDAFLRTNFEYVYAAGDCVEFKKAPMGRRNIEQVWYTGKMMGEIAALNVLGNNKVYEPGPWFNSAKFFDIEYQTYGQVDSEPKAHQNVFFWENEAETKCLKIITDKAEGLFVGINAFGIRLRHELFDKWLREGRTTDFILGQWKNALFDPEFHKNDSKEILDEYNKAMNKSINLEMKNWKKIWS